MTGVQTCALPIYDALLRAGRFDRRVKLSLPNINDRELILELYLKSKIGRASCRERV